MEEKNQSEKDIVELPIAKQDPSIKVKEIAMNRRFQIIERVVKKVGFYSARAMAKALGEQYEVSERTIYKDFDWIKGNIKPEDLQSVKIDLKIGRNRALQIAIEAMLEAKNVDEKVKASNNVMNVLRSYREELEGWGEKVKIADPQSIMVQQGMEFNLIEKTIDEIKNERTAKHGDKPEAGGDSQSTE